MVLSKKAFTLIEVMVAVMITSVVIAALLQMRGDTNNFFIHVKSMQRNLQFLTFLQWQDKYGFEDEKLDMYRLVEDFNLDDKLRRELKMKHAKLQYERIKDIDLQVQTVEIGKTILHVNNESMMLHRIRYK